MYIEKVHIEAFGKLSDRDFDLCRGVNIIEGENESGKSTLAAFIKFIFYGVSSRERAGVLSWERGGAAGSITVCDGDKRYRVERALVGNREAVQLVDADTNMVVRGALDGTTPGELFFGVGADMFAATAFVSQLGKTSPSGAKVSDGIENILFSADESVNTQKAMSKLDSVRVSLLHKNEKGGRLFELDAECAAAEVRLGEARRGHDDILAKEAQLADLKVKHLAAKEKADGIATRIEQFTARRISALFARSHSLEGILGDLRAQIVEETGVDVASINKLEQTLNKISLLKKEADQAATREAELPPIAEDAELDEYVAHGGVSVLFENIRASVGRARTYKIMGATAAIVGIILAICGVLTFSDADMPALALIIGGAAVFAVAVVLFVLGVHSGANAKAIADKYDFDALEDRLAERNEALEAAKLATLARDATSRSYNEAYAEAQRAYGCDYDRLVEMLDEQKQQIKYIEQLKSQYDKYESVFAEIQSQLAPYDEASNAEIIDDSVDVSDVDADKLPELNREAEFSRKMAESLEKHIVELEKTLAGLYPTVEEPTVVADKLSALKAERETLAKRYAAYKLALEKMSQASDSLRESIAPRLAKDTALLMGHLTCGKYSEFGVGTQLELCVETENGTKGVEALSAGTQDAAYLCLRMALISLLYRKTTPPVIYDEAFSRLDNGRLLNMMKIASIQDAQSIMFTSNSREADTMRTLGEFNLIKM